MLLAFSDMESAVEAMQCLSADYQTHAGVRVSAKRTSKLRPSSAACWMMPVFR
jgi:hypothetical protein